jgi:hypothetical protein
MMGIWGTSFFFFEHMKPPLKKKKASKKEKKKDSGFFFGHPFQYSFLTSSHFISLPRWFLETPFFFFFFWIFLILSPPFFVYFKRKWGGLDLTKCWFFFF